MLDVEDGIGWSHNRYRGTRGETAEDGEPSPSVVPLNPELDALIAPAAAEAAALPTVDLDQVGLIGAPALLTLLSLSPVFIRLSSSILPTLAPMRCVGGRRRVVGVSMPAKPVVPPPPP